MKRWLRPLFQIASILVFLLIVWWSGAEAWAKIANGIPKFILLALLMRGVAGMMATTRLKLNTTGIAGSEVSWRRLYYVTMTTRSLGLIIPRSVSTIGGKSVALRSQGISLRRSIWIVLVDNMYDLALLGLMAIPAFLVLISRLTTGQGIGLALILIISLGIAIWWGTRTPFLTAIFLRLQRHPWIAKRFGGQLKADERLLPQPWRSLSAYLTAVILNGVLVFSFLFIAQAVGTGIGLAIIAIGFPFVQLSLVAAVTPGGLGLFDLGWLGLLALGGVSEADALTFVVAQRAYVTIFVLVWTGVSILLNLTATETVKINGGPEVGESNG